MPKTEFGCKSYAQNKIGGQNSGGKLKISQTFRNVFAICANFARLRIWQWLFANLAMRIFAKVLKCYVRQMNSVLALRNWHCEIGIAKFAKVANRLPTDCQLIAKISALLFFQNMLQNLHKSY